MAKGQRWKKVIDGRLITSENGLQARDSLVKGSDGCTFITIKNGVKAINGFTILQGYRKDVLLFRIVMDT